MGGKVIVWKNLSYLTNIGVCPLRISAQVWILVLEIIKLHTLPEHGRSYFMNDKQSQ